MAVVDIGGVRMVMRHRRVRVLVDVGYAGVYAAWMGVNVV